MALKYALHQTLAYIPCWIRIKILCVGTTSVLQIQELHQGEWSEFVISSKNNQAYKAIKGHEQEGEKQDQDFYLSLNHGRVQRKKQRKIFLFSLFFLVWQNEWMSAAPFKSDYLTFRNGFTKETAAYHETANRMRPSPPAPRTWEEQLKMCRTKRTYVLHHRRQVLISFHYASSPLLPFAHCLPQGKLYNLKIMSVTFLLLHKRHVRFPINISGQTF